MRLPEVIQTIASDANILWWNKGDSWYEVLDGPRFEERFNSLRLTRGKRKAEAIDRPFARMHVHFELLRGDKWAGTGSAFRPRVPLEEPKVPYSSLGEPEFTQSHADNDRNPFMQIGRDEMNRSDNSIFTYMHEQHITQSEWRGQYSADMVR